MRILIVEDEWLVASTLADALTDGGHQVIGPASTADEALALCITEPPDLAILNINLHSHIGGGLQVAQTLLGRWGIPSIFASGSIDQAHQAGTVALAYIQKPYLPSTVLETIAAAQAIHRGVEPARLPAGVEWFRNPN